VILLDTNVASEPWRPDPDPHVRAWLAAHPSVAITAVTVLELLNGVRRLPHGSRRERAMSRVSDLIRLHRGRVLGFDERAAVVLAEMAETRRLAGRPLSAEDGMIAAIAAVAEVPLATRNTKDFEGLGIDLLDPWTSSAG
jgi:predicted nucleic acid-binding protein